MKRIVAWVGVFALAGVAAATEAERVTMSLDEFLELYEKARTRPPGPVKPPEDHTLSSIRYEGEVVSSPAGDAHAEFIAKIRVDRHATDGWSKIPVLSSEAALIDATLDGKPAPLVLDGSFYHLVTNRTGALDLRLRFAVAVTAEQGASSFSFPMVRGGSNTLRLAVPADGPLDLAVSRARVLADTTVGGKRVIEATLPPSERLAARWQRETRATTAAAEPARVYTETNTLVGVGDGLLRATATVGHTILFSGVDTLRYDVPDGMTVLDVRGSGLRDWSVAGDGTLTVALNYAAEDSYTLSVDMERAVGEGSRTVEAPLLVPLGVERSKGFLGVTAAGNLEVAPGAVTGAAPVDVRALPAPIVGQTTQPVLLGYKYLGSDAKVPLVVTQYDEVDVLVTLLDQAEATTMFTEDGRRLTSVRYEVRNNRRQYLRLTLPTGAELWSAGVAGRAVQPAKAADGAILMPLIRSASSGGALSSFGVEVVYVESMDTPSATGRGRFEADLPRVDVPTTYLSWTVYAPHKAKIAKKAFEGSLRAVGYPSRPLGAIETLVVQSGVDDAQQAARASVDSGALGNGAAPVKVELPLDGQALHFEKLLALDERLWVGFDYAGLK